METPNSPEILTMALNMHDEYNPTTFALRDYKTSNKVTTMVNRDSFLNPNF